MLELTDEIRAWEEDHREYLQTTYRWLQEIVFVDQKSGPNYETFVRLAFCYSEHSGIDPGLPFTPPPMSPQKLRALPPWKPEWRVLGTVRAQQPPSGAAAGG